MTNIQLNQWINIFYRHGAIGVDQRDEFKQRLNVVLEDFTPIIRDLDQHAQWLPEHSRARWLRVVQQ